LLAVKFLANSLKLNFPFADQFIVRISNSYNFGNIDEENQVAAYLLSDVEIACLIFV